MPKSAEFLRNSVKPINPARLASRFGDVLVTERFTVLSLLTYPFLLLIKLYQVIPSPFAGGNCRFYPTCSCYGEQALRKHGLFKGSWMTLRRILRCHPWHEGGYDPVN